MNSDAVDALRAGSAEAVDPSFDEQGRVPHGSSDDPWVLDFSANTNPEVPDGIASAYEAALAASRSYPADEYCEYRGAAADYLGCEGREVIPTPGGLAAIRLTIQTTVDPGGSVLVPAPSFGEYAREVRLQGADPVFADHDEILRADPVGHDLAIVCNPNNPTGEAYDPEALREFADRCRAAETPLLVDEAFLGFTDHPSMAGREGVIVARSLTKLFGLPGLRAGFAVATGRQRDRLDTARIAWSIGTPAAVVGAHCMRQEAFVVETRERVDTERERLARHLRERFDVRHSDAPFLLVDVGSPGAVEDLLSDLRTEDIAVRDARTFRGLDSHVRIAVRRRHENDRLIDVLDV